MRTRKELNCSSSPALVNHFQNLFSFNPFRLYDSPVFEKDLLSHNWLNKTCPRTPKHGRLLLIDIVSKTNLNLLGESSLRESYQKSRNLQN